MTRIHRLSALSMIAALLAAPATMAKADTPSDIALPSAQLVAKVHAEGAQVYECKTDSTGELTWEFREPVATLLVDGKTVGRHYAGLSWEFTDSSAVTARLAGRAPGATANDIPLLKLAVTGHRGSGRLTAVTAIQRLNTQGGKLEGPCDRSGALVSIPYAADYTFLQEPN